LAAGSSAGADAGAAAQNPNASRRPQRAAARANVAAGTYAAGDDDEEQDRGPCQPQRAPARKRPAAAVIGADLPEGESAWQKDLIKTLRSQQKTGKAWYGHLQLRGGEVRQACDMEAMRGGVRGMGGWVGGWMGVRVSM
jgi:hypothetical protein